MNKQLTISIGGDDITLNLGVNYFYKYFKEATGIDLIKEGIVDIQSVKIFDYTIGFIYAGYAAECKMNALPIVHKPETVEDWVMRMNDTEATEILLKCSAAMSGKTVDEIKNAETQAASNGVAKIAVG